MDDLAALREEIERLRDLCEENGIDPDPYFPPPPKFGPPTLMEHMFYEASASLFKDCALRLLETSPLLDDLPYGTGAGTLRICLPKDFTVTR